MQQPQARSGFAEHLDQAAGLVQGGQWSEALAEYEALLARVPREGTAADAADVLRRIGYLHQVRGELDVAQDVYGASLAVAECGSLVPQLASALIGLATVSQLRGGLEEAEALYERARSRAEAAGEERIAAMAEQNMATLANIRGDVAVALRRYAAALERHRRLGDQPTAARTLNNMGMAHVDRGDWTAAEQCYEEAFEMAERLRDPQLLGNVALNRAELSLKRKAFAGARDACDLAFEIFGRLESTHGLAEAHKLYGALYRETRKPHLAATHLELAGELARTCKNSLLEAEAEAERALLYLEGGRNPEALRCLNHAHRIFLQLQARRDIADIDQRLDGLEVTFLRVTQAWAESIESQDAYTAGHCERVADYACRLAEALGITGRELVWFRMGAFLHDVGKIEVPTEILNKPGKLTDEEWQVMQAHTTAGDRIVAQLDFPWDVRPLVRSHHEHWAGTGYPDGLTGEQIPLHARILCVADVYDALTTTRSYRPALSQAETLRIMERDSGRIFDPQLFRLFRALVEQPADCAA